MYSNFDFWLCEYQYLIKQIHSQCFLNRSTNFSWGKPIPPNETAGEEEEEVDDSELNLDKVEEEMAADYSDEEEEEILHIDDLQVELNNRI